MGQTITRHQTYFDFIATKEELDVFQFSCLWVNSVHILLDLELEYTICLKTYHERCADGTVLVLGFTLSSRLDPQ
jgi:hypothetical protein